MKRQFLRGFSRFADDVHVHEETLPTERGIGGGSGGSVGCRLAVVVAVSAWEGSAEAVLLEAVERSDPLDPPSERGRL